MHKEHPLFKKAAAAAVSAVIAATSAITVAFPSVVSAADANLDLDNYARLMQYSLYFFDANYCGEGAGEKSHFSWRDDCHKDDAYSRGGFHDAGDGILCGLTEGFTASTLGWMYYEYKNEFDSTGTTDHLRDISNEFASFMKASTTRGDDGSVTNFIYEVGDDGADHGKWRAPELMPGRGRGEFYSTSSGASDVAAQYAAALAQSYINFGNSEDLDYAIALYDFAAKYRTITYDQMTYSDKSAEDDIAWAANWLYLATKDDSYLADAAKDTSSTNDWTNDYYYGGVWLGAALINAEITGNWTAPVNYIKGVVNANQGKFYVMNSWGSARHNTLMQTCALVATKHKEESGADFADWCQSQMNMILGDNNANVSLVVGYNSVSATSPHHRAASGLYVDDGWSQWGSWSGDYADVPTSHVLYGALCGGPTSTDFSTFRKLDAKDATSNEVALDYQIGLVGAAVGLYSAYGTGKVVAEIGDEVTVYPSEIAVANGETPVPGTTTTVDPSRPTTTTTKRTTTTTTTVVTTKRVEEVNIDSSKNAIDVKVNGADAIEIEVSAKSAGNGNGAIDYTNTSGQYQQFGAFNYTMSGADTYVTSASLKGVNAQNDTITVHLWWSDNESVISKINLVYYDVVDVPTTTKTTTTTSPPATTTTATVTETESDIQYGDANCDGKVDISDAVMILQAIANSDKYGVSGTDPTRITEQGMLNADCNSSRDGVTTADALTVQKYVVGLVTTLPIE